MHYNDMYVIKIFNYIIVTFMQKRIFDIILFKIFHEDIEILNYLNIIIMKKIKNMCYVHTKINYIYIPPILTT